MNYNLSTNLIKEPLLMNQNKIIEQQLLILIYVITIVNTNIYTWYSGVSIYPYMLVL